MALQCRFIETGFYQVTRRKRYYHPLPNYNRVFLFNRGGGTAEFAGASIEFRERVLYLLPRNNSFSASYEWSLYYSCPMDW